MTDSGKSGAWWNCAKCGEMDGGYMITRKSWEIVSQPGLVKAFICLSCADKAMQEVEGRSLGPEDFLRAPINHLYWRGQGLVKEAVEKETRRCLDALISVCDGEDWETSDLPELVDKVMDEILGRTPK